MARIGTLDFEGWLRTAGSAKMSSSEGVLVDYAYASDRQMRSAFEQALPVRLAVEATVRLFKSVGRNELLGSAVRVGPAQFPRVHGLLTHCSRVLAIPTPTLYIVNNPVLNAATYGTTEDSFILVHSGLVDHMSDEELTSVLAHECGHIHNSHVVYLTALHFLTHAAGVFLRWIVAPAMVGLRAWSRRAEITCDRASLLCTREVDVSTRAITKLALGSRKLYEELNLDAFVAQFEELREGPGRLQELLASHPWLPKRVLAMRAFSESELYRRHVGLADEGLTMEHVDQRVREIVRVL